MPAGTNIRCPTAAPRSTRTILHARDARRRRALPLGLPVGVALACLIAGGAAAQEAPPRTVPRLINPYVKPADAIVYDDWLLFPSVSTSVAYDSNVLQSSAGQIATPVFHVVPSIVGNLNNGIYQTTVYGRLDGRSYFGALPDAVDVNAGVSQRYEARRDLIFNVQADYSRVTTTSQFINAIPSAIVVPSTPNSTPGTPGSPATPPATPGSTPTPTTPTGPSGLSTQGANGLGTLSVNPSDQFTVASSVTKLLNRAFFTLGSAASYTAYETHNFSNYSSYSTNASGGFWFSPRFYAYTQNSFAWYPSSSAEAYRLVGGIGSDQIDLFRGSLYGGYQGSNSSGGPAGGAVAGAQLTYLFKRYWTFRVAVDETWNFAQPTLVTTNDPILALNTSTLTSLAVPLSASTKATSLSFDSIYALSRQWSADFRLGYLAIDYVDQPRVDTSLFADASLAYQWSRNMSLSFDYQYSTIVSNVPNVSSNRHVVTTGAQYRF